jgi:hypothetical protein
MKMVFARFEIFFLQHVLADALGRQCVGAGGQGVGM